MSESQSRYSIVQNLTKDKLKMMSAKGNLSEDITKAEQRVVSLTKDIEYDKKVCQQEADKQIEELDKTLRDAIQTVENLKGRKEAKEKLCDEGIRTIDAALTKLEEISKSSQS